MDKKYFLLISGVTLVALVLAIMLPGGRTVEENPRLPWLIELNDMGYVEVFGITIGKSTLADARKQLQQQGKVNLFVSADSKYAVEAYFKRVHLSGLRADMVLALDLDQTAMEQMYDRGLRISQLESGSKKVKLSEPDMATVERAIVEHITYIPATDLDEALVLSRFGEPERRINEPSRISHWLYPSKGLDIAMNPEGKEVFQYLPPANFNRVLEPLLELSSQASE